MRAMFCTALVMVLASGCSNPGENTGTSSTTRSGQSRLTADGSATQLVAWGDGPSALGLRAEVRERAAFGVPAVAVGPGGQVFALDAVNQRIVRVDRDGRDVTTMATVPRDADDLAIGADGAFAVHRAMTPKILVLDPAGQRVGEVDAASVGDVDAIVLAPSRRVVVRTAFQETFQLGSPSAPQLPQAIARSRKVGAELLESGDGLVVLAKDGVAELRVMTQAADQDGHAEARTTYALGSATTAHIVGVSGRTVCMRIEHADTAAEGPIAVRREARCLDTASGATVFRTDLPAPGLYVPRRELTFTRNLLVFAHPEKEGLRVSTWTIDGGAR